MIFLCIFLNNLSGFEIEPYPLTEMLGEISSEVALQGAVSQAPSAMSSRPIQTSSPTVEELAKPIDYIQVKHIKGAMSRNFRQFQH